MRYIVLFFLFSFLFNLTAARCLCLENPKDDYRGNIEFDIDEKDEQKASKKEDEDIKPRKYSDISANREHIRIKNNALNNLNKNKAQFEKRIDKELYLLRIK